MNACDRCKGGTLNIPGCVVCGGLGYIIKDISACEIQVSSPDDRLKISRTLVARDVKAKDAMSNPGKRKKKKKKKKKIKSKCEAIFSSQVKPGFIE